MTNRWVRFASVALLSALGACESQVEQGGDVALEWAILETRHLRDPNDAMSPQPWGIAADPARRRVYVADAPNQRILVFDAEGNFVDQFGRRGAGPGELGDPWAVALGPDGSLTVLDYELQRISYWTPAGEWITSGPMPPSYWGPDIADLGGQIVLVTNRPAPDELRFQQDLVVFGDTAAVVRSISQNLATIRLDCLRAPMPVSKPVAPQPVWSTKGDTILVLQPLRYAIDFVHDGRVVKSFERDIPPVAVSKEMALERIVSGELNIFVEQCGVDPQTVAESMDWQETVAPVQRITVAPDGRIWATRTGSTLRDARVDVFETDGRYVGTVEGVPEPIAFLAADEFVAFAPDDEFGTRLQILRIAVG